jgi:hypothetical protein
MHQPVVPGIFQFILLSLAALVNASQPFHRVRINLECSVLMFVFFFQLIMQFTFF